MMKRKNLANEIQVGGDHYQKETFTCPDCGARHQHWDIAWGLQWDSFMYPITKYLWRHKDDRIKDLKKARHYIDKYIEVLEAEAECAHPPDPVINHLHVYAAADAEQAELEEEELLTVARQVASEKGEVPLCCNCAEQVRNDQTQWTCPAHGNMRRGEE